MKIEQIAELCHEANRAYCSIIGDISQPTWENAPQWQRDSAINGVSYHIANPTVGPEESHNNWVKTKFIDGWKYGTIKDPQKKEHPCMIPYGQLPSAQRMKDHIFCGIVRSIVDAAKILGET